MYIQISGYIYYAPVMGLINLETTEPIGTKFCTHNIIILGTKGVLIPLY